MKQVTVNWPDLKMAFEDEPDEFGETIESVNYFDKTSGVVVFVDELVINVVGNIIDELDAELAEDAEWRTN